ncbi:methyl-accepting chemotaxis protein [Sneathiella chinensis]|uniref:Methyl-accepting chemotaxis protein n=1 Tax=Sneathiella chinensis TaxID=349750 RepID=A0ABQ5U468_9PROT|nr:methyl-accepting chemotaxis protein [Sneathiella chinensis]GLQ06960.1 methyl-accepting chemotaxis protein [Sneathiella chinensis]
MTDMTAPGMNVEASKRGPSSIRQRVSINNGLVITLMVLALAVSLLLDPSQGGGRILLWLVLALGIAAAAVSALTTGKLYVQPLSDLQTAIDAVRQGRRIQLDGTDRPDEIGQITRSLLDMMDRNDSSQRLISALDTCNTNVMVADVDYNIVYVNGTMLEMLKHNETMLQADLPQFRAEKIVGANIDSFHKNPAHQRSMLDTLHTSRDTDLEIGGRNFKLIVSPIFGDTGDRLGTVVEWEDVTEHLARQKAERQIANENSRIKAALDNCSTNIMVADADYNIVYVNDTMNEMLFKNENNMRKELPQFDAKTIIGTNIDGFHVNPAHQRGMLDRLAASYKTSIAIGGRNYHLIASPVLSDDNERIGTVVEWADVTAEKNIEREIDDVVTAAVEGDFTRRIDLDGKDGFMLNLSTAINNLSGTVSDAMQDIERSLTALSKGDLTCRIDKDYAGLFDILKMNANNTADQLADIVRDITTAATEVANAAEEINTGTMDLSQRTETQASNLEETAAAMEEMASTVKQNAENAQQANQLSVSARDVATKGGDVVREVVDAMSRIENSSQKISDIIGVIDEIAFQTNLLALNAAVEAARAGDAGKGFAVVAAEVGTLAQRSSQAAKDIKGLINDSGSQVKDGVRLVGDAGDSLTEIVDSIKRLSDIVSEIAAASNEQSTSIEEINRSVAQMDEMTQQNSALVEENAAAARTLQEQSVGMQERVTFFTLDQNTAGARQPESRSPGNGRMGGLQTPSLTVRTPAAPPAARPNGNMATAAAPAEDWSEF